MSTEADPILMTAAEVADKRNTMRAKRKAPRQLINHRRVAALFGTSARNWRRWYNEGVVPIPHQEIGTLLLYDEKVINHRLETGLWPAGVKFRPGRGQPEDQTAPSDDETPMELHEHTVPSS